MKKFTFTFPTYEALSQFADQSKALNISIAPKQNLMTGLFGTDEIDLAVNQFHAISNSENLSQLPRQQAI